MLVKIALALIIFWLVGLLTPNSLGTVIHSLPVIAIVMIMISDYRRRQDNPYEN